jgi:hypothetical protein
MVSDPVSGKATRQGLRCPVALQGNPSFGRDAVVIGGCGHAGLPLTVALAGREVRV